MKYTVEVKELENSQVELLGSIEAASFETFRPAAIKKVAEKVTVDGFRKGKAPEKMILEKAGEMVVLEEMAHNAISEAYILILREKNIHAIGRPEIMITKLAADNDLEFRVSTAIMPTVTLSDYKKIAKAAGKDMEKSEVTEEEVKEALVQLQRMRAHSDAVKATPEGEEAPKMTDIKDADLKDLDDEYVKELGDFTDVADFTDKLKQNLIHDKEHKAYDKFRLTVIDNIIESSEISVPQILVDYEIDKMMAQMEHDVSMMGMKMEDYLKNAKKTVEDIRKEFQTDGEKRAKMQLIIQEISEKEEIGADADAVEKEVTMMKERYGDMKDFDADRALAYVTSVLTNQAVFAWLEKQAGLEPHAH